MTSKDNVQKRKGLSLPFGVIEMMDKETDFQTHTRLRATCKYFQQFLQAKIVDFTTFERLVKKYRFRGSYAERNRSRIFQDRVHLHISPSTLNQKEFEYLVDNFFDLEVCRISWAVLGNPSAYKHINLLYDGCYSFVAAAIIGDIDLMKRLLLVPNLDPSAGRNRAILWASLYGQLESVRFLLPVPKVDPTDQDNLPLRWASGNGHVAVSSLLLTDSRVLDCYRNAPFYLPAGVIIPP